MLVETTNQRFKEALSGAILFCKVFERIVNALFLFEFKTDLNFTKLTLVAAFLLPTLHTISVLCPGLSK